MTIPFAGYLILFFTNLPVNLPRALSDLFAPFPILEKLFIIVGLFILAYSAAHLIKKRKRGLVTSGPYSLVRHPQYLGITFLTLGLTSWSFWILNNTFGIGFLKPSQTIGVWFIELFAYVILASIEEQHLSRNHGKSFENYKSQVPFFIPFIKTKRHELDILVSIIVPALFLFGLLAISRISPIL